MKYSSETLQNFLPMFYLNENHMNALVHVDIDQGIHEVKSPLHMEQSIAAADLSVVKINKNQNGFSNLLSQHNYGLQNHRFLGKCLVL